MKRILSLFYVMLCVATTWAEPWPPGVYEVGTLERFKEVISHRMTSDDKCIAEIKLTADIYLNDCSELCRTFTGTLDGNGFTIYAGDKNTHQDGSRDHGKYLFTYSEGAAFKNLTFKDFRADTDEHSNWSILTSQAINCTFQNITFDNVSVYAEKDNVGAVAGIAENCTFTNITVKNSDFTADDDYAGGVVGKASNNCTFTDIQIKNSFIKLNGVYAGGVAGHAQESHFTNCIIDDMSCVCADGSYVLVTDFVAYVGGVTGSAFECDFHDCVNSALIAADGEGAGGISGWGDSCTFENCLNTGMLLSIPKSEVEGGFYSEYKDKQKDCITKRYLGKEYVIKRNVYTRTLEDSKFGGIVGAAHGSQEAKLSLSISRCTNLGFLNNSISSAAGGIVGYITGSATITDCLSDCEPDSKNIMGIAGKIGGAGDNKAYSTFNLSNTLNVTPNKDYELYNFPELYNFNSSNMYSYYDKNITKDEVLSGVVCAKLGENWEQNIGVDPYPAPTGEGGLIFADNLPAEKYIYAGTTSNVTIKRTFNNDGWYSICLPFDVDATQTAEMFAEVAAFKEQVDDTYKFTTVSEMKAGKAYIVKVDSKLENPKFTGVTIANNVAADETGPFVGILKPTEIGDGCKVIGSGTTVNPVNAGTMKAFRAYFTASTASTKAMFFSVDEGVVTSVESIQQATSGREECFNLNGQKVGANYRGIVIKNGKKFFNK